MIMFMYTMFLEEPFHVNQPERSLPEPEPIVTTHAFMVLVNESNPSHSAPMAQPSLFSIDGTPVVYSVVGSIVEYHSDLPDIEEAIPFDLFHMQNENRPNMIGEPFYQNQLIIQMVILDSFWVGVLTIILFIELVLVSVMTLIDIYLTK